jgi:glucosamine kinase
MKLIADAGSTKTAWRLIANDGSISQINTLGFSPFFADSQTMAEEFTKHLSSIISEPITDVYYYGTGCSTPENCEIVRIAIQSVFSSAKHIEINTDMLGAARGLCGHDVGIACILGTGSNSCLFDGTNITYQVANLGFWLGDEGSGGYLGKALVTQFLLHELPTDLAEKFAKRYPAVVRDTVLENAYKKPAPNRYFAGFAKFLFDNRSHPYAYKLVYDAFDTFLSKYICKYEGYKNLPVHFTGSIAFYHSDILRQVANDKGIILKNIMENPIAGLTLYHQS